MNQELEDAKIMLSLERDESLTDAIERLIRENDRLRVQLRRLRALYSPTNSPSALEKESQDV